MSITDTQLWKQLPGKIREFIRAFNNNGVFDLESTALEIFDWQRLNNKIYKTWLKSIGIGSDIDQLDQIPHLPIQLFKNFKILSGDFAPVKIFKSSGTTGSRRSKHLVADTDWYELVSQRIFEAAFGKLQGTVILALLPGYLQAGDSSLVYMVRNFMQLSGEKLNGFFLDDFNALRQNLFEAMSEEKRIILFGVPYALLDFCKLFQFEQYSNFILIETGGMKGRKAEMPKAALHELLKKEFQIDTIYSEYGMTELLSQAYTDGSVYFSENDLLKIRINEINDPFTAQLNGKAGQVNVIDLANIFSCSFIKTGDLGISHGNQFEILGRLDNAETRGCNLLYEHL